VQFTKMHGLGNDFVIVVQSKVPENAAQLAQAVCNRRTGIGADGLVFIVSSEKADCRMRIFNADGTESEQCGNALRCVAKYYAEKIAYGKPQELLIETGIGVQKIWLTYQQDEVTLVRVDMGEPILEADQVPVISDEKVVQNQPISLGEYSYRFTAVSMGNPHAVIEVEDPEKVPLEIVGPQLEKHPLFPRKTNVEFITIHSPQEITMRVWERGVGETMACGSGACAVVVASALNNRSDRKATVHLLGGDLFVEWSPEDQHVYMTGAAEFVFEGVWLDERRKSMV
jgi:diaminopimelate epimerase